MAFEPRTDWKNFPDETTPVKAQDLIRIEQGIADASEAAEAAPTWGSVTGKPSAFPAADHDHAIADVTGLQSALDGKQASGNYATTAQVNAKADQSALAALEARVAALEAAAE